MIDNHTTWPMFAQYRIGQNGEPIIPYKFLTLRRNLTNGKPVQSYGTFDPRATQIGSVMRRYGLDEFPQLANVLEGSMSLVGPRPKLPHELETMEEADPVLFDDWLEMFVSIKPGIAGESQLYRKQFRKMTPEIHRDSMMMDLQYAEEASLAVDLRILGKTPVGLLVANMNIIDNSAKIPEISSQ